VCFFQEFPLRKNRIALAVAMAFPFSPFAFAQTADAPSRELGIVTITSGQPTSLPTQIPTTMEGITREQIEQTINATDSEDALKYFPSLLVRKRYIGDYNHAILSSRASGTGNSARSAVYADGILLSNFLGNGINSINFPPRWGLVTPEEIERVDVMYGPFSAAYPGNSVGAVVDYVTRMPTKLEGHAKVGWSSQPFELYGTRETYRAWQASASVGSKSGDWSYWINVNRTDSQGQPLGFASRAVSTGTAGGAGTPVTGAVAALNTANQPIWYIGHGTQYHTVQDHAKVKLAYDFSPTVRAAYTLGSWQNTATNRPQSYLRNGAGAPVTSGPISIDGRTYGAVTGADLALQDEKLRHTIHGLSLKSRTQDTWDWEVSASRYDYGRDIKRQNAAGNTPPAALNGGAGTLADAAGTGWTTFAARGTWRPDGLKGPHIVDFGYQQDHYQLAFRTSNVAGNWMTDGPGTVASDVGGQTRLRSLWAQDAWRLAQGWKTVLGLRAEQWTASDGYTAHPRRSAGGQHPMGRPHRKPPVAQGGAVVAVDARHGAQGLGGPRGALPDGGRAVWRHGHRQFAVHQRPQPASPSGRGPASCPPSATWAGAWRASRSLRKTPATRCIRRPCLMRWPTATSAACRTWAASPRAGWRPLSTAQTCCCAAWTCRPA
jgi:iron complex outermembrane receptor protein